MDKLFMFIGGLSALLGVILGAFGAHGLKKSLSPEMLSVYQTGINYHLYHAMALLLVGIVIKLGAANIDYLKWSGYLFVAGIILFSGSLYLLSITGNKLFGPITPMGGLCFIAGWLLFSLSIYKSVD